MVTVRPKKTAAMSSPRSPRKRARLKYEAPSSSRQVTSTLQRRPLHAMENTDKVPQADVAPREERDGWHHCAYPQNHTPSRRWRKIYEAEGMQEKHGLQNNGHTEARCESPVRWGENERYAHVPPPIDPSQRLLVQMLSVSKREKPITNFWCSRGFGRMLLSFAAGGWFALTVISTPLGNNALQHMKGGVYGDMPSAIKRTYPLSSQARVVYLENSSGGGSENENKESFITNLSSLGRPFDASIERLVQVYPTTYSDITQSYPFIDSDDMASSSSMEMRVFPRHETDGDCVPMSDWQKTFHPTCSMFHETDLSDALQLSAMSLISAKGNWRDAWELLDWAQNGWSNVDEGHEHSVVLKTFKYEHNMEDAFFEFNRVDAISMDQLTSSPFVMDIYGFCGMSVVTSYAGESVTAMVDTLNSFGKLHMARLIARGLADIHGIDGGRNITLVHNDINYANIMIGGKGRLPRFNDFNLAVLQMWNTRKGEACQFTHHFPNPQWRSPEEQVDSSGVTRLLTEKIDVYALGNIYYRFLAGSGPWKKAPWRTDARITREDKDRIARMKRKDGAIPPLPQQLKPKLEEDPALMVLFRAMKKCYMHDPADRPSARELVRYLDEKMAYLLERNNATNATGVME